MGWHISCREWCARLTTGYVIRTRLAGACMSNAARRSPGPRKGCDLRRREQSNILCLSEGGALEKLLHESSPAACSLRLGNDHDVDGENVETIAYWSR